MTLSSVPGVHLADHALPLDTLDPAAPFDDLEPLAERFRAARVVAVGESAHHVREYHRFRHRLLRFLVERCGFTAFGLESGFSEGLAVDAWVRGGDGDVEALAEHGITYWMGQCAELREQLAWMRTAGVRYVGLDVPGSTASPLAALAHLRRHFDPAAVPLVDRVVRIAEKYAGEHALPALNSYAQLDRSDRDAVTATLAELGIHLDASPAPDPVACHELRLVALLDQGMRAHAALPAGGPTAGLSARDRGMAETALWALDHLGPDARIVLGAANNHVQRTPVALPTGAVAVAGTHLAHRLGGAYLAVAMTAVAGATTTRRLAPDAPGGVELRVAELAPPAPGSLEAALPAPAVTDLAAARGRIPGPDRIRLMDGYQPTPVLDAFDLAVTLPHTTPATPSRTNSS